MAIKETLTEKAGPLPGWAWVVIAAGGFYLWRRHHQNASAALTTVTDSNTPVAPLDDGDENTPSIDETGTGAAPVSVSVPVSSSPITPPLAEHPAPPSRGPVTVKSPTGTTKKVGRIPSSPITRRAPVAGITRTAEPAPAVQRPLGHAAVMPQKKPTKGKQKVKTRAPREPINALTRGGRQRDY